MMAAVAAAALVLQTLLLSMAAPQALTAAAVEQLALHTLCLSAAPEQDSSDTPFPVPHRADHACCILCTVPGLAAGGTVIAGTTSAWDASLAAPLATTHPFALLTPAERAPIQARAPPA